MYNIVSAVIYVWLPVEGGRKNIAKARQNNNGGGRQMSLTKVKDKAKPDFLAITEISRDASSSDRMLSGQLKKTEKSPGITKHFVALSYFVFSEDTKEAYTALRHK